MNGCIYTVLVHRCMVGMNYSLYMCIGNISCSLSTVFTVSQLNRYVTESQRMCFFSVCTKAARYQDNVFSLVWSKCSLNFLLMLLCSVERPNTPDDYWKIKRDLSHILTYLLNPSCQLISKIFFSASPVARYFCGGGTFSL